LQLNREKDNTLSTSAQRIFWLDFIMRHYGTFCAACCFSLLYAALCGCGPQSGSVRTALVMGTQCRIELFGGTPELYEQLFERLDEIDRMMSVNRPDSEISRVNAFAGLERVPVSPDLSALLERARYFAEASGGAFDPTVGPLVRLWGIGGEAPRVPSAEEIRAALDLVNWRDLELEPAGMVFLRRTGMELDLGAIAKGFAADELAKLLETSSVRAAIIDLGGNIYVYGTRPARGFFPFGQKPRTNWRIGVQDPRAERGVYAGYVETGEGSVVTSGVYERFFIKDSKRWHHILDTASGFPVEGALLSVTITARSSMDADALSTAIFVMGYEKGRVLAETHDTRALFIFDDGTIRGSGRALNAFTLTSASFRVIPSHPGQRGD
jgi:thiamine biosynthesis lipoprotein